MPRRPKSESPISSVEFPEPGAPFQLPRWQPPHWRLPDWDLPAESRREAGMIALLLFTVPYVIALWDLQRIEGSSWLSAGIRAAVVPVVGFVGAWLLLLPLALGGLAIWRWRDAEEIAEGAEASTGILKGAWIYSLVLICCALAFSGVIIRESKFFLVQIDKYQVGWLGMTLASLLMSSFGAASAKIVILGLGALALPLFTGLSWREFGMRLRERWDIFLATVAPAREEVALSDEEDLQDAEELDELDEIRAVEVVHTGSWEPEPPPGKKRARKVQVDAALQAEALDAVIADTALEIETHSPTAKRQVAVINTNEMIDEEGIDPDSLALLQGEQQDLPFRPSIFDLPYEFPSLRLLADPAPRSGDAENVEGVPDMVEKALGRYGVTAYVERIIVGPSITRVECIPSDGTRMNKIANLENDLQFHLAAKSVRVEAPIPGRKAVGIEFPNKVKELVMLKEILASEEYQSSKSILTVGLGKDLAGKPIVADLTKMPHLLIAGQTGAGKSVCLNTIIMSLLFRGHPSLVKMILVDPKRVELSVYDGLPHLLVPVVQDVKKALNALNWAVMEMDDRYKVLQQARARNIAEYNARHAHDPMPFIVIIIDELADLMDVGAQDIERLINRLARLARAVGIHLILATQRPDVKVITGQIKANIPTRIAFKVASIVDSKTILDYAGADKLLGFGDMLFKAIGESKPIRAQGCFVDEHELGAVIERITSQIKPDYNEEILVDREEDLAVGMETGDAGVDGLGDDGEYWDEALQITLQEGKISASMLQRRLRIGYNRAARLVDLMEAKGIISGPNGAKPRELLNRNAYYESVDEEEVEFEEDED